MSRLSNRVVLPWAAARGRAAEASNGAGTHPSRLGGAASDRDCAAAEAHLVETAPFGDAPPKAAVHHLPPLPAACGLPSLRSVFGNGGEAPYNGAMTEGAANFISLLVLGFVLGMRHATDADHIVAVATIVSRQRTMRGAMLIGAAWGIGHSLTVMAVGGAIILFDVVIPPWLGLSMEFAVGGMLVLLGVLTLTGMGRGLTAPRTGQPHDHVHAHGDYIHRHPHGDSPETHGHSAEVTPLALLDHSWLGW